MLSVQSRANQKIKKGDLVKVLSGKDRGKTGTVLKILSVQNRVIVEKLNLKTVHEKPNPQNQQQGGISKKEGPIHMSNIALLESAAEKTAKKKAKKKD